MITIRAFSNAGEAVIVWSSDRIPGCIGFALQRKRVRAKGKQEIQYVENRVGFQDEAALPGRHHPSDEWPFQQYFWVDHDIQSGDRVQYRVLPAFEDNEYKSVSLSGDSASEWTEEIPLSSTAGTMECYFNRGFLLDPLVRKVFKADQPAATLQSLHRKLDSLKAPIPRFLYGDLGRKLLDVLDSVSKDKRRHLYAALCEVRDRDLAGKLEKLGARAHLVLSQGSTDKAGKDENSDVRKKLRKAGVEVHERMLWSRGLARNNFMVICDGEDDPQWLWTGSLNWTTAALCAQIHHGLFIQDSEIARQYYQQWQRLRDAGSDFPEPLTAANDAPKQGKGWTIWFTRTSDQSDLEHCRSLIRRAHGAIFFLLAEPGPQGLHNEMIARRGQLYVHGVVSSLNQKKDSHQHRRNVNVQLIAANESHHFNLEVMQPEGARQDDLAWWVGHFARRHSPDSQHSATDSTVLQANIVVIDPFGNMPVVITGSHHLGTEASEKNDENLIIVEDNRALAEKYVVHIAAVYDHFRWRRSLLNQENLEDGLRRDDRWQDRFRTSREKIEFWMQGHHA